MLTKRQATAKRAFDLLLALTGLTLGGWVIVVAAFLARIETGRSGIFRQTRVGLGGKHFSILKIRTMRPLAGVATNVTTDRDPRITRLGRVFRKTKIDELPQLINVLLGEMSFVGPRPDVPEIVDVLTADAPQVLSVRPGITGPASLKYRREEELLAGVADPELYNRVVIFPDKVRINSLYVENYRFSNDLKYLWQTFRGSGEFAHPSETDTRDQYERKSA